MGIKSRNLGPTSLAIPVNFCALKVIGIGSNDDYGCVHDTNIIPEEQWRLYNFIMVMLQYILPLVAVTFTYGHMAKVSNKFNVFVITVGLTKSLMDFAPCAFRCCGAWRLRGRPTTRGTSPYRLIKRRYAAFVA